MLGLEKWPQLLGDKFTSHSPLGPAVTPWPGGDFRHSFHQHLVCPGPSQDHGTQGNSGIQHLARDLPPCPLLGDSVFLRERRGDLGCCSVGNDWLLEGEPESGSR